MRAKIFYLLIGVFALIPNFSMAADFQCYETAYSDANNNGTTTQTSLQYPGWDFSQSTHLWSYRTKVSTPAKTPFSTYRSFAFGWNATTSSWVFVGMINGSVVGGFVPEGAQLNSSIATSAAATAAYNALKPDGCGSSCDTNDSDTDGVCNACDKVPNANDPEDCLIGYSTHRETSTITGSSVDVGCKSKTGTPYDQLTIDYYHKPDSDPAMDRHHVSLGSQNLGKKSCKQGGTSGDCCAYPADNATAAAYLAGMEKQNTIDPNQLPTDKDKDAMEEANNNPNSQPKNCSDYRNQCESICSNYGGVERQNCYSDSTTGRTMASCTCAPDSSGDDFDYSDDDGTQDDFSDGNGTGNDNGGLSAQDSKNLHDIESNTASTAAGVRALGDKIEGVGDKVEVLGGNIDGVGDNVNALGDKLDNIADKLDDQQSGNISMVGSAPVPDGNEYDSSVEQPEEENFIDAVHSLINNGLPVATSIRSSHLSASGSGCMQQALFGRSIDFCLTDYENIWHMMGLILVSLSTMCGFYIVIRRA